MNTPKTVNLMLCDGLIVSGACLHKLTVCCGCRVCHSDFPYLQLLTTCRATEAIILFQANRHKNNRRGKVAGMLSLKLSSFLLFFLSLLSIFLHPSAAASGQKPHIGVLCNSCHIS